MDEGDLCVLCVGFWGGGGLDWIGLGDVGVWVGWWFFCGGLLWFVVGVFCVVGWVVVGCLFGGLVWFWFEFSDWWGVGWGGGGVVCCGWVCGWGSLSPSTVHSAK